MPTPLKRAYVAALPVLPIVLAFVVYLPRVHDYFALDDFIWLRAVAGRGVGSVTVRAFTFPAPTPFAEPTPFWRPASVLFFYFEHLFFGLHPTRYHAINIALHGIVGALGGILTARLTRSRLAAGAAAVLFVAAPSYDFAVTWISQFSELLAAACTLTSLLLYYSYLSRPRGWPLLAGAVVALAVALLSKESAIVAVPLLVMLPVVMPPRDLARTPRAIAHSLAPLGVVAMAYLAFALVKEYRSAAATGSYSFGIHVPQHAWEYLQRMSMPYAPNHMAWVRIAQRIVAIAYLMLGGGMITARRRAPSFFFIWSIIAVVPFSLFRAGIEWRYTYLATLPYIAFLASSGTDLSRFLPKRSLGIAAGCSILLIIIATTLAAGETRRQQSWISAQARAYEQMVTAVRRQCGNLPPRSFVYVTGTDSFDLYGVSTRMAVNLFEHQVYVARGEPPPIATLLKHKCIVRVVPSVTRGS